MPPKKKPASPKSKSPTLRVPTPLTAVKHKDKRVNIPTEELRDFVAEDEKKPKTVLYPRDPSLDPQLVWKGKDEQDSQDLAVPAVPVYIQEKIHPQAIIENVRAVGAIHESPLQPGLFNDFNGIAFEDLIDFYRHEQNWANRMILGDSLMVMTSLAEKEGLKGKVQMIYFDPPYGIKFGSNWQVSTRKRDVKDGKAEDATRQPEQIKAFRDTWQLGIHSYLSYLRDRLMVARELLTESGSVFVQIGDENVHLVRSVLEEVFGSENFVALIPFKKTSSVGSARLDAVNDYLVWYSRDIEQVKYRQIYSPTDLDTYAYPLIEMPDSTWKRLSNEEKRNIAEMNGRLFRTDNLTSQSGGESTGFAYGIDGQRYSPSQNSFWKTNRTGMEKLHKSGRLLPIGSTLTYKRFQEDFPVRALTNWWDDTVQSTFATENIYVVQTYTKVIERCLLMTNHRPRRSGA